MRDVCEAIHVHGRVEQLVGSTVIRIGLMGTSESVLGMTERLLRHAESVYASVEIDVMEVALDQPATVDAAIVAAVAGADISLRDPSLLQGHPGAVVVWNGQELELLRVVMPSRRVFEAGHEPKGVTFDEAVNAIARLLWDLVAYRSPERVTWQEATERLIRELVLLVDERDSVLADLAKAGADLEVARERITQLEHLVEILEAELVRTKGKESSKVVRATAAVALVIITALVNVSADYLKERVAPVDSAAQEVVLLCDRDGGSSHR